MRRRACAEPLASTGSYRCIADLASDDWRTVLEALGRRAEVRRGLGFLSRIENVNPALASMLRSLAEFASCGSGWRTGRGSGDKVSAKPTTARGLTDSLSARSEFATVRQRPPNIAQGPASRGFVVYGRSPMDFEQAEEPSAEWRQCLSDVSHID
jgi:hypothetical protein